MWGGIGEAEGRRELETPRTLEMGDGVTKTVPKILSWQLCWIYWSQQTLGPGACVGKVGNELTRAACRMATVELKWKGKARGHLSRREALMHKRDRLGNGK